MKKLLLLAALALHSASAELKTINDVLGRDVKVDVPVKNAVLMFYFPDYIAATGLENFKHIHGISREFWEKYNAGSWQLFVDKIPELKNIADVGHANNQSFSLEKTLSLKPDAVIMGKVQYNVIKADVERMEAAGIPVVVVDFNDQTVANHTKSIRIFGQLAGTEERANALADEYAAGMEDIEKRVAAAKGPKPKIYIEFGDKGPGEYSYTFGNNMWGAIARQVGGDNIAAPFVENWGPISAEQFLSNPPDVVMISGTEKDAASKPDIMAMGIGIKEEDARRRLAGFTKRLGWDSIPAVKNKRVYGLYHTASRSITDLASAQFIAKALYPEQFKDVDPLKNYLDFHKKYLGVEPQGTFFLEPQDQESQDSKPQSSPAAQ